jgi:hypothetical protein
MPVALRDSAENGARTNGTMKSRDQATALHEYWLIQRRNPDVPAFSGRLFAIPPCPDKRGLFARE